MRLKQWTVEFLVNDEVRPTEVVEPTFWTERGADRYAAHITRLHKRMYGDLYHNAGSTLHYRPVRRT